VVNILKKEMPFLALFANFEAKRGLNGSKEPKP
jgi:hypothetical protein